MRSPSAREEKRPGAVVGIPFVLTELPLDLNIMFTHPEYRGRGVGDLLMAWGVRKADDLGYEMWLNASELGLHLYKKHGFVVVEQGSPSPPAEGLSPEWTEMRDRFQVGPVWLMWRPVGGSYVEGETAKPWE